MMNLNLSNSLFELTLSNFKPIEPKKNEGKKSVRKILKNKNESTNICFVPNIPKILNKIDEIENLKSPRLNLNPMKAELRTSFERLKRIRVGCSLFELLKEKPIKYKIETPKLKFSGVGNNIRSIPENYNNITSEKFLNNNLNNLDEKIDNYSRINIADKEILKLNKIISDTDKIKLQYYNEGVQRINHSNERRFRSMKLFYENVSKYGFENARKKAKRSNQQSRLRIMGKFEWWEEFIEFCFKGKIDIDERRLIESISRVERLNTSSFVSLVNDVKESVENNERCLELLNWINNKCQIIDQNMNFMYKNIKPGQRKKKILKTFH